MVAVRVVVTWPDRRLSPNARVHHMELARAKKAARHEAWAEAMAATTAQARAMFKRTGRADVRITFHPPRAVDKDNAIASFKAAQDGIADAIGVDDGKWSTSYRMGEVVKDGAVVVEVLS